MKRRTRAAEPARRRQLGRAAIALLLCAMLGGACTLRNKPAQAKVAGDLACQESTECPVSDSPCLMSMCLDAVCVYVPAPQGPLPAQDQIQGDCQHKYCDGNGEVESYASPPDVPAEDGNRCTEAACQDGAPTQQPHPAGMACGEEQICTGTGYCGVCLPEQQRCDGHAIAACDEQGRWQQQQACSGKQPVCRASKCVGVAQLYAGAAHVCARFDDDSVRCWGADRVGWSRNAAAQSRWSGGYAQLSVGAGHACGVTTSGALRCWGRNDFGQLGAGNFEPQQGLQQASVGAAKQVAVGREHSCALLRDGSVWCWGRNDRGQLGVGAPRRVPGGLVVPPPSGTAIRAPQLLAELSAGGALRSPGADLCVTAAGGFACIGAPPRYPAADFPPAVEGDDDSARDKAIDERKKVARFSPARLPGLSKIQQLGCGDDHCCALGASGAVYCWGAGERSQLGQGKRDRGQAAQVATISGARQLVVGAAFACAIVAGDTVRCWGDNRHGQLGREGSAYGPPAEVVGVSGASQLVAGRRHACVLDKTGAVRCWGDNRHGQSAPSESAAVRSAAQVRW